MEFEEGFKTRIADTSIDISMPDVVSLGMFYLLKLAENCKHDNFHKKVLKIINF